MIKNKRFSFRFHYLKKITEQVGIGKIKASTK